MCGIIGLHLRDPELNPQLGTLMRHMLEGIVVRGPDSAGVALYGDRQRCPEGYSSLSLLNTPEDPAATASRIEQQLGTTVTAQQYADTTVVRAKTDPHSLDQAVRDAIPEALHVGLGDDTVVYKGVGHPLELAEEFRLSEANGWQGIAHTRMATESAIDAEGCHPYSVGTGLSLVHNGSFSNHATIRRQLQSQGVKFDSENDTEVGARFVESRLNEGDDLQTALETLGEVFDGFYTLLVTTNDGFAVVRDEIACKPAIIAEHPDWVAMGSEFQALASLPGIQDAKIFEPEPGRVYTWKR